MKLLRGRIGARRKFVGAMIAWTCSSFPCVLFAQSLEIQSADQVLSLVYPRPLDRHVTVEVSNDLFNWELVNTRDSILETSEAFERVKSVVDSEGASRLYFRLAVSPRRDVTLQWDAVDGATVGGYRVHLKRLGETRERLIDVGNTTLATISMPGDGRVYFFCVTTYDQNGTESEPSAAVGVRSVP